MCPTLAGKAGATNGALDGMWAAASLAGTYFGIGTLSAWTLTLNVIRAASWILVEVVLTVTDCGSGIWFVWILI